MRQGWRPLHLLCVLLGATLLAGLFVGEELQLLAGLLVWGGVDVDVGVGVERGGVTAAGAWHAHQSVSGSNCTPVPVGFLGGRYMFPYDPVRAWRSTTYVSPACAALRAAVLGAPANCPRTPPGSCH